MATDERSQTGSAPRVADSSLGRDHGMVTEKRVHGMTLSEVSALRMEPTAEDIAWAEKALADHLARQSA